MTKEEEKKRRFRKGIVIEKSKKKEGKPRLGHLAPDPAVVSSQQVPRDEQIQIQRVH